jgi:hypothetical protein
MSDARCLNLSRRGGLVVVVAFEQWLRVKTKELRNKYQSERCDCAMSEWEESRRKVIDEQHLNDLRKLERVIKCLSRCHARPVFRKVLVSIRPYSKQRSHLKPCHQRIPKPHKLPPYLPITSKSKGMPPYRQLCQESALLLQFTHKEVLILTRLNI